MVRGISTIGRLRRALVTALLPVAPLAMALQPAPAVASTSAAGCHLNSAGGAI